MAAPHRTAPHSHRASTARMTAPGSLRSAMHTAPGREVYCVRRRAALLFPCVSLAFPLRVPLRRRTAAVGSRPFARACRPATATASSGRATNCHGVPSTHVFFLCFLPSVTVWRASAAPLGFVSRLRALYCKLSMLYCACRPGRCARDGQIPDQAFCWLPVTNTRPRNSIGRAAREVSGWEAFSDFSTCLLSTRLPRMTMLPARSVL
jgi:hypothetical protein